MNNPFLSSDARSHQGVVPLCAALLIALIIVLIPIAFSETSFVVLAFILGVVLLAPLAAAAIRMRFEPLEPIYFCIAMFAYLYLMKPVARLLSEGEFLLGKDELQWAMTLAIIGLLAMYAGYYVSLGPALAQRLPLMARAASRRHIRTCAWVFILIGATGLWLYMEHSGGWRQFWSVPHGLGGVVENFTAYIWQLPELMIVGFFLILHDAIADRRLTSSAVVKVVLAALGGIGVYTILWSRRTFLLWAMVTVFAVYFLEKGRRPRVPAIFFFGLMLFTVLHLTLVYRPYLHLGSTAEDLLNVAPLDNTSRTVSQTQDEFDSFLAVLSIYPSYLDYDYFGMYLRIPLHPIPRLLWPDKPPLFISSWDDFLFLSSIGKGAAEGILGNLYIGCGLIGIIAGMFASGVLWRALFAYLQRAPHLRFVQLVYAVALGNVPSYIMQSPISAFWKWFPIIVPGVVFAYWLASRARFMPGLSQSPNEVVC